MRALSDAVLERPRAALALLAALSAFFALGATRLETQAGYRAFLGSGHPAVRALDAFTERFGGGLPFAAVWSCGAPAPCERVFDAPALRMAHDVARALEAQPGVVRVDGPATSPLLVPDFGLPTLRRLAPRGEPAPDLEELAARALADPMWAGQLVSPDGRAGALLIHLGDSRSETGVRALARLRESLAPWEDRGFRFHLVGGPVEFVVAGAELARGTAALVPVMVGLVGLILLALFRSLGTAAAALVCVGGAVLWTLGLQGWLGWPQTSLSQALPPLVLVIGVCDAIHLLAGTASRASRHPDESRASALRAVVSRVGPPCLLTTLTTAAGFASFGASGLESLARFGWLAAFGVCAALLFCFSLLPLLALRLAPARRDPGPGWARVLDGVTAATRRRPGAWLVGAAGLAALGAWGIGSLRIDARFEDLYGADSQVVRWVEAASRELREAETLELALVAPPDERWDSARALALVARAEGLAELDGLARPLSILTPLREIHQLMHREPLVLDGSEASGERARSMLRLLALEDPSLLRLFVDRGGGALRVSFQAGKTPQAELRALLAEVRGRLEAALPSGWTLQLTGPLATVGAMIDEIRRTQLVSFAVAGTLVLLLIALFFRSVGSALLALVPTGLPVLLTLGAMGWAGIALDVGSAMVAAVVLGLAVDNAIHLLSAYRARRGAGAAPEPAIAGAVRDVGRALSTSALALGLGFLCLALAPWRSIASFGLVSAVAIAGALAAALLVLPALITAGSDVQKFSLRSQRPPRPPEE